jgi:Glycosyltransferase family 87
MAGLVFAALSTIPMVALKWLVTAGSVASLAGTLWLTWGMLGYRRSPGRLGMTLTAAGVALWLLPVQQTLGLGQVNLILMLIIVADLCQPDTVWMKGAGVGLAAGFKLTPLIFIPYLVLTRRFRAAGLSLAVFGLTIAGSLILLPRQARQFWFGGLFLIPGRTGNTAYVGNQSLDGALVRLLGSVPTARPYWLGISVAICAVGLLFAAWTARRGQETTGILICALTGLLVSPISWSHHWVWMAPALVVAADAAIRLGTPVRPPRPGRETVRLTSRGRWPVWWRWACRTGLVALIIPFFALPQNLVPRSTVQGASGHGTQLLTSNLYVIDGSSSCAWPASSLSCTSSASQLLRQPETAISAWKRRPPRADSGCRRGW